MGEERGSCPLSTEFSLEMVSLGDDLKPLICTLKILKYLHISHMHADTHALTNTHQIYAHMQSETIRTIIIV